ncbi:MAG TPA: T9SS type A sorting domain-containing protein, partial [Bacteroidetes bacterium]|nr:T9SS type A sorting domain-containing protein [Bacteroidota bacterium]HEX05340.1 T9SS type A sorting domain-containing protein [Bacteroidota bacterium]
GEETDTSDAPFAIVSPPTASIDPHEPPVIIPHYGSGFWYWVEIENSTPFPVTGQYWTEVIMPNGGTFGPLSLQSTTIQAWGIFAPAQPTPQWVPAYAPPGTYEYVMNVGVHPDLIVATDSFEFEKLAGADVTTLPESMWSIDDWHNEAWELAGAPSADAENKPIPTDYTISPAHPNPFNPSTTISVSLPDAVELTVVIYNLRGQQVAELASGYFNAGTHQLTFDASILASGLYFIRANVPGQLDQVQKVMLVR